MKTKITSLITAGILATTLASQAAVVTVPTGLSYGDQYRLVFVTSTTTAATETGITFYNDFVDDLAGTVGLNTIAGTVEGTTTWTAMASVGTTQSGAINVKTNTSTVNGTDGTGMTIYTLNDTAIATSYADLWDGGIASPLNINELGNDLNTNVWTGSGQTGGTSSAGPLGASNGTSRYGQSQRADGDPQSPTSYTWWFNRSGGAQTNTYSLYAISGILTVPEPSSTALLGLGGLALIFRRRK